MTPKRKPRKLTERERFEAWACELRPTVPLMRDGIYYVWEQTEWLWHGWQASARVRR
jgi:hypothetical protein